MTDNNIPAFPCAAFGASDDLVHQSGMTLRDWFAGMALQSFIKLNIELAKSGEEAMESEKVACIAYEMADAMMKARESNNASR